MFKQSYGPFNIYHYHYYYCYIIITIKKFGFSIITESLFYSDKIFQIGIEGATALFFQ